MAVVEMRRVTILGQQGIRDAVLRELQLLGTVQVDDVREALAPEEREALFREVEAGRVDDAGPGRDLEVEAAQVKAALDLLDRFFRPKKGVIETFAGIRFPLSEKQYRERAADRERIAGLVGRARELDARLAALAGKDAELRARLVSLNAWKGLDVPREALRDTRLFRVATGQVGQRGSETLAAELEEAAPVAGCLSIGGARDALFVVLYYPKAQEEAVLAVVRRHDWTAITLPEFAGTVAEEVGRIETELAEQAPARQAVIREVEQLLADRMSLYARSDHLQNEQLAEQSKDRLGYTGRLFVLRGWARRRDIPRLRQALERLSPALVLEEEEPAPGEVYPVDLENAPLFRPFEVVTRVAGLPAAGALDPSPYLAPFFFVFFGLMLGDAGYGILLTIAGFWLVKRAKAVGLGRQLLYLLAACGVSTFLAGVMTGSWFGNLFGIKPLWFDPLKEPVKMLILSLVLGVIQIFTALGVKAYDNIRKGNRLDALYDQGFWLVFLSGLLMMLVGVGGGGLAAFGAPGKYLALGGAIALVLTQGRSQRNILARLGSGVLSLYGVSAYLSDVLSYSRILALGLSGTVIAMVLNFGANLVKGVPFIGWLLMAIILVAGHIFDLLISAVGAYVHASRLQYVEFFTKFFEAGGRPFKPLAEGHRYLIIEPEAAPAKES